VISFDSIDPFDFQYSGKEMISQLDGQPQLLSPQEYLDRKASEEISIIDLRDPEQFARHHLETARNIPMQRILDKDLRDLFQSEEPKLLVDHDGLHANQAWMLLTQFGYPNLYVLEGGMQNWKERVEATTLMKSTAFEDEAVRFEVP
jgi:rhodanese-related sulfurtransferase